jgi:hypothetical protein
MDRSNIQTDIHTNGSRGSVSVHGDLQGTGFKQSHNHKQNNGRYKRHRYYKYILAVILGGLFPSQSLAETVGGVSATASPVANSSGSVTNQAIQVLQGPYITNTYGGGIQCQGPTRNFTPYVTGTASAGKPYEPYYWDPVYDISDLNEDGLIDNPGDILFHKKTRTGQKDNYSLGVGFSMTWSTPIDKNLQDLCKQAARTQIELNTQLVANKRLDFEIARLKNCGELIKKGIMFHPKSPYYKVCADVVVQNVTHVKQHTHHIPPSTSSSDSSPQQNEALKSLHSSDAALLGAPLQTQPLVSYPE